MSIYLVTRNNLNLKSFNYNSHFIENFMAKHVTIINDNSFYLETW